jgi:hypothetical protein
MITSTDQISLSAGEGEIYYTLDGSTVTSTALKYLAPFTLSNTTQIKSRVRKNSKWSALNEALFIMSSELLDLIITELHYHPLPSDNIDDREFEFIELYNSGSSILDLSMAQFIKGIDFLFPANTLLQPKEYIVLASSKHYFQLRYGISPL